MLGYVINLKKRPDRLERFKKEVENNLKDINIEVVEAFDGKSIDFNNKFMLKNINKWNYDFLNERQLRGVIGCCLSHLKCFKKLINSNEKYCIIFEDDCIFRNENLKKNGNDFLKNINIPEKFGIIFLNEWNVKSSIKYIKYNEDLKKIISGKKTTESYIISKDYAQILYNENIKNIGAIDEHISMLISKYPDYPYFELNNNLFIQYDRTDTNIQF